MKTISTELQTHLQGEVTTIATCWKLTLRDTTVMGFTSHDVDLTVDSVTYEASSGFTPDTLTNTGALEVDTATLQAVLNSDNITEADIAAGRYDYAEVEVFQVNYADLTQGALSLRRGWLGEVAHGKTIFQAELHGLTQRLQQTIGNLFSPTCRAVLGDAQCAVNLASYTATGSVTSLSSNRAFTDSTRAEANGFFDYGKVTFTSGANNGLSMEVKHFNQSEIVLMLPMPHDIAVSDTYSIVAGCDKTFGTCASRFSNAVNFRGEPHVPGANKILETSRTRSNA